MEGTDLRAELSRNYYVRSRTARTAAFRMAYIAYARTVAGWQLCRPTAEARASLRRRIEDLFERDWQDANDGLYPRELIEGLPWREYALAAPKLIADLPKTRERIRTGRYDEVPEQADRYPRYYARNFRYQTDGYLGHTSAELYDLQVELIFGGTADAMRRRLVPPVVRYSRTHGYGSVRAMKLLDVACGTGHLLRMLGKALPDARLFGLDLSPQYIARARETLPREMDVSLVCDDAEKMPFVDGHFDAATNLYLLHEVPREVRTRVLSEMFRVVRPGGLAVVADSLQFRAAPELTRELRAFPERFHEPYYDEYATQDLALLVEAAGFAARDTTLAFLTKIVVAEKPR